MPNHTANILTVSGPIADVRAFVAKAKSGPDDKEPDSLDFNQFVPMPEELRGTTSPVKIMTQAEIDKEWERYRKAAAHLPPDHFQVKEGKPFALGITQATYDDLVSKYGYADWYSWALGMWGTKWGAYNCGEWQIDGDATLSFQTAWSPPVEFLKNASELYPTLSFKIEYADEGGGFVGSTVVENGVAESNDVDWNCEEGIELRKKVGYWHDEDEDE